MPTRPHPIRCQWKAVIISAVLTGVPGAGAQEPVREAAPPPVATVQQMIDARTDVWGNAAMRQPNGASYDFFKELLPPVRWVNTSFRHYPIVLGAPRSQHKARLVSNGSAVNARADKPPMWYEQGVPIAFFVGTDAEPFGAVPKHVSEPKYVEGYLPIVNVGYSRAGVVYAEEVFAPVGAADAAQGTAFVRFYGQANEGGARGRIEARVLTDQSVRESTGVITNERGECLLAFSSGWHWDAERKSLVAELNGEPTAELAIYMKPATERPQFSRAKYDQERQACIAKWKSLLERGIDIVTPEPLVNDAWRATLIGTYMLAVNDRLHYSAGNAYAKLYEAECGDTLRSIMLLGHLEDAPAMLRPLLEFDRQETRFHVAGHKLQLLAYFHRLTGDARTVRAYEPIWRPAVELIVNSRQAATGLLPKDRYAGDIEEKVHSLNSNANCWRGLRDVAAMLAEMGSVAEAERLQQVATEYRASILKAVERSERSNTVPPFIPVALLADEPAHNPLTATRKGSYYDLICPYVIGSEVFGQGSKREDSLLGYLQQHGGIALGMVRTMPSQGQFKNEPGVVPLYGLRYQLALLRRDEREKALVGFYGQLAQGMTRGTFIGGEGVRFVHGDAHGRSFYLPPNSTSNATWLVTLRHLLVQDWDLDEDARPETLRLLYGVPRMWLAEGRRIRVDRAPTPFGLVSFEAESKLSQGAVLVRASLPERPAKKVLLRAAVPAGWRVVDAEVDGSRVTVLGGNVVEIAGAGAGKNVVAKFIVARE